MYKITLFNKWLQDSKWKIVKSYLYHSEEDYERHWVRKSAWCESITRPVYDCPPTLFAKLVGQKFVNYSWQTIKETTFGNTETNQ